MMPTTLTLFDFSQPQPTLAAVWGPLNDGVMGGLSQSQFRQVGTSGVFSGRVSTENSGGFASVRTRDFQPPLDLSGYTGIELRLRGDGNRYKFFLRPENRWDGLAFCSSFDTVNGQWITVQLPFAQFVPVIRAKTVSGGLCCTGIPEALRSKEIAIRSLIEKAMCRKVFVQIMQQSLSGVSVDRSRIYSLQLMLSKFELDGMLNPHFMPGPFQLQIGAIAAYC